MKKNIKIVDWSTMKILDIKLTGDKFDGYKDENLVKYDLIDTDIQKDIVFLYVTKKEN